MRYLLMILLLTRVYASTAQTGAVQGNIMDASIGQPVAGVTICMLPGQHTMASDAAGHFSINYSSGDTALRVTAIGYAGQILSLQKFHKEKHTVFLKSVSVELSAVTISPVPGEQFHAISKIDIALRDLSNSQEVLRLVPGLFIGQHQGGGKAEQIFLRGFDCDHGTDISISADGMPVNLVSHAHGQGYADTHFIIPETIGSMNFNKGPYYADKGDFCTSGWVDFHTMNFLPQNMFKLEGGMFHTARGLIMMNLLGEKAKAKQQSLYAAAEYRYTDSYFDNPQHFNRFNFFTKYYGRVSESSRLSVSASYFFSRWNASGQIPERAVSEGITGFYGALDPNEGGNTSRTNVNAQLTTTLPNGDLIRNQVFYAYYTFDLNSNFSFFLKDTVNGDGIRQKEARNFFGYQGSFQHHGRLDNTRLTTEAGIQFRGDATQHSLLAHTKDRYTLLEMQKLGNITDLSAGIYFNETLKFSERLSMNAGLRFDQIYYDYNNKLASDTSLPGTGTYKASDHSLNPKLSFYYQQSPAFEFYLNLGKGFHSNDARAVVADHGQLALPGAYGIDMGTIYKPVPQLLINAALWYLRLDQENVYAGDGGTIEYSGETERLGFDLSARYQAAKNLFLDLDLNYAHGRSVHDAKNENYIPLAPVWTSAGGITYTKSQGFNGSLRYRYMADRPANENYSLKASGYFVTDLVLNYTKKKFELGLNISNLLNTKWKETQFATLTRLKGEAAPVDEICFTPGTPFAARLSLTVFF